jgi:hypothetical protein
MSAGTGYAVRSGGRGRKRIMMHRLILGLPPGRFPEVDHINHDTLDNRRINLRIATRTENLYNTQKCHRPTTSRHKGVRQIRSTLKWEATIKVDGKQRFLGTYVLEEDAARAYNAAARELRGEYALLNDV